MATSKRSTEVRQGEIVRAALELIGSRGLEGLRVAAVARKVGLVPSAIYRHYRSKDEVLDAILEYIQARLRANVRAVSLVEAEALARLRALLTHHVNLIRESAAIPMVVFSGEVCAGSPRRREQLLGIIESYLADVAILVEQGQREGSVRPELEPGAVAMLFLGLIQPSALVWHLSVGRFDVSRQAEAAWPLFCRAIQTQPLEGAI
jgi:AcrR family transcriptional regulator